MRITRKLPYNTIMRIILCILALTAFAMPAYAVGAVAVRQEPVQQLPQWQDFSARQSSALHALEACEQNAQSCSKEMERWAKLLGDLKPQNKLRQIITVNRWFNRLPYKHDEYAYDTLDHWADTSQLLEKKGDCEDYALSKYYSLRRLGFTAEQLKVMVVYDQYNYINHAVLMVYMDGARYMLDINADSTSPEDMELRYKPIYGFNEQTAWFY